MAEGPLPTVPVVDLRGAGSPPPGAVLADPSGRRARLLGRGGRVVGLVFIAWFCCLVLAGLGLLPAGGIPLGSSVTPTQPKRLARIPAPRQPSRADLRPATPLRSATPAAQATRGSGAGTGGATRAPATTKGTRGSKKAKAVPAAPVAPSVTTPGAANPVTTVPHGSATAPGHSTTTSTTPGHSGAAPGTTTHAHTTTTTTTTTSGKSGSAPGQTRTDTTGHGPPG